jgi:hypothetical protein
MFVFVLFPLFSRADATLEKKMEECVNFTKIEKKRDAVNAFRSIIESGTETDCACLFLNEVIRQAEKQGIKFPENEDLYCGYKLNPKIVQVLQKASEDELYQALRDSIHYIDMCTPHDQADLVVTDAESNSPPMYNKSGNEHTVLGDISRPILTDNLKKSE